MYSLGFVSIISQNAVISDDTLNCICVTKPTIFLKSTLSHSCDIFRFSKHSDSCTNGNDSFLIDMRKFLKNITSVFTLWKLPRNSLLSLRFVAQKRVILREKIYCPWFVKLHYESPMFRTLIYFHFVKWAWKNDVLIDSLREVKKTPHFMISYLMLLL